MRYVVKYKLFFHNFDKVIEKLLKILQTKYNSEYINTIIPHLRFYVIGIFKICLN